MYSPKNFVFIFHPAFDITAISVVINLSNHKSNLTQKTIYLVKGITIPVHVSR